MQQRKVFLTELRRLEEDVIELNLRKVYVELMLEIVNNSIKKGREERV